MRFVPMLPLLSAARAGGYAVPAFCVWNVETARTVLTVAAEREAPVILMGGPSELELLEPAVMAAALRAAAIGFDLPAALLLDHGESLEQVRACLDAGYTSVMLDWSARPFAENAAALRQVAEWARPLGVTVEGEIGVVGRVDDVTAEGGPHNRLTEPAEAAEFVARSGVDVLAVAIGNAHGDYARLPRLDFERLAAIRGAVDRPLVLHGGTGTPTEDLRRAIELGIAKVNVATECVNALRHSLVEQWHDSRNRWIPLALAEARAAHAAVVGNWLDRCGATGRAGDVATS